MILSSSQCVAISISLSLKILFKCCMIINQHITGAGPWISLRRNIDSLCSFTLNTSPHWYCWLPWKKNNWPAMYCAAIVYFSSSRSSVSALGMVLGISIKLVTPPATAAAFRINSCFVCKARLPEMHLVVDAPGKRCFSSPFISLTFPFSCNFAPIFSIRSPFINTSALQFFLHLQPVYF